MFFMHQDKKRKEAYNLIDAHIKWSSDDKLKKAWSIINERETDDKAHKTFNIEGGFNG